MRAYEILSEAQFANMDKIKAALATVTDNPQISSWLQKKFPKWIGSLTDEQIAGTGGVDTIFGHIGRVRSNSLPKFASEPWVASQVEKNLPVYYLDKDFTAALRNIVDWLGELERTNPPQFARIERMNFQQAVEASNRWHEQLAKRKATKASQEAQDGSEMVLKVGDYSWWKLTTEAALKHEGACMGHCVGSYGREVASGQTMILSLRDAKGTSHVTIELRNTGNASRHFEWSIEQVKGKQNEPPILKYAKMAAALKEAIGKNWMYGSGGMRDLRKAGMIFGGDGNCKEFAEVAATIGEVDGARLDAFIPKETSGWNPDMDGEARLMIGQKQLARFPLTIRYQEGSWSSIDSLVVDVETSAELCVMINDAVVMLRKAFRPRTLREGDQFAYNFHRMLAANKMRMVRGRPTPDAEIAGIEKQTILDWLKDPSVNGYGALSAYIYALISHEDFDPLDAVKEAKKLLPAQRSNLAAKYSAMYPEMAFLYYDKVGKSYWFYDINDLRITERHKSDLSKLVAHY